MSRSSVPWFVCMLHSFEDKSKKKVLFCRLFFRELRGHLVSLRNSRISQAVLCVFESSLNVVGRVA